MIDINKLYDKKYYGERMAFKPDVYPIISDAIMKFFEPKSLIDVGCGNGVLLEGFQGVDCVGIEGSIEAVDICIEKGIPCILHDLRHPFNIQMKHDLAVSIEVAEHIEENYVDIFLDNLCSLSDTIIMTASPLEDGGKYHFNVKNRLYWVDKMDEKGYYESFDFAFFNTLIDKIPKERNYLYKNMMIFKKNPL